MAGPINGQRPRETITCNVRACKARIDQESAKETISSASIEVIWSNQNAKTFSLCPDPAEGTYSALPSLLPLPAKVTLC